MTGRPIVLVQGAWGSSASWTPVAEALRASGHRVHVPSLTGLGERRHLFAGSVSLSTHVADVVGMIEAENLRDMILVGHSYGGMVITAVADAMADRISGLVYLDAFVPSNGQSVFDQLGPERVLADLAQAGDAGGVGIPPPQRHAARVPEAFRFHMEGRSLQPLATMVERIRLSGAHERVARRHYISAVIDQAPVFAEAYARVRGDPRWTTDEIETGHMLQLERPNEVAEIVSKFASSA